MLNFLAVSSFEEYEDLATDLVVRSRWDNPFGFDMLAAGESFFFPMVEHQTMIAVWMLLVALLFLWYIKCVNRADIYVLAAIGLTIFGLDAAWGFNTLYPSVLAIGGRLRGSLLYFPEYSYFSYRGGR